MDSNVAELLSRAATREPDKTALSEATSGRTITWNGLDDLVERVVQGLSDAGMVAGYRVMVAAGNSIEFVCPRQVFGDSWRQVLVKQELGHNLTRWLKPTKSLEDETRALREHPQERGKDSPLRFQLRIFHSKRGQ